MTTTNSVLPKIAAKRGYFGSTYGGTVDEGVRRRASPHFLLYSADNTSVSCLTSSNMEGGSITLVL